MSKIVVYDFDGTLSYGDSMEEIFTLEMSGFKTIYKLYYYFLKVLSKLKISTVKKEKEQMIKLLFHSDEKRFKLACEKLSESYVFSPIMQLLKKDVESGKRVIVLSASSVYFLEKIFSDIDVEIYGTTFQVQNGKILRINQHPFYYEKVNTLVEHDVTEVDEAYFDSRWDDCLKPMCVNWHKVKNGVIVEEN